MQIASLIRSTQERGRSNLNIAEPMDFGAITLGAIVQVCGPNSGRSSRDASSSLAMAASRMVVIPSQAAAPLMVHAAEVPEDRGAVAHPAHGPSPQKVKLSAATPCFEDIREAGSSKPAVAFQHHRSANGTLQAQQEVRTWTHLERTSCAA